MEYRDLYDKNKNLIGKTIKQYDEIPEGSYILVVLSFIRNSKGDYLIQKRSKVKSGRFAFTGGHAKTGEDGKQAIITEIYEELGLLVDIDELEKLYEEISDEERIICEAYSIVKDFSLSDITVQEEEVEGVMWCTKEEVQKYINSDLFFDNHIDAFHKFLEMKG